MKSGTLLLGLVVAGGIAYVAMSKPVAALPATTCELDAGMPGPLQMQITELLNKPVSPTAATAQLNAAQQMDALGYTKAAACLRARAAQYVLPASALGPPPIAPTPTIQHPAPQFVPAPFSSQVAQAAPASQPISAPYNSATYQPKGI